MMKGLCNRKGDGLLIHTLSHSALSSVKKRERMGGERNRVGMEIDWVEKGRERRREREQETGSERMKEN